MKNNKINIAKLALMGLASGLMVSGQAFADDIEEIRLPEEETQMARGGCGNGCGGQGQNDNVRSRRYNNPYRNSADAHGSCSAKSSCNGHSNGNGSSSCNGKSHCNGKDDHNNMDKKHNNGMDKKNGSDHSSCNGHSGCNGKTSSTNKNQRNNIYKK